MGTELEYLQAIYEMLLSFQPIIEKMSAFIESAGSSLIFMVTVIIPGVIVLGLMWWALNQFMTRFR